MTSPAPEFSSPGSSSHGPSGHGPSGHGPSSHGPSGRGPAARGGRAERVSTSGRRLERAGLAFETGILEELHARQPDDIALVAALAEACTRLRRYRRGLELDRRLVEHDPADPGFRYNLACSCSLTGDLPAAASELLAALALGYRDFAHLLRDADLRRVRGDAVFAPVRERMEQLQRKSPG
jgi:predicted Zn-dependent protease